MEVKERVRRCRARKRGESVPLMKPGPKVGYRQTEEHKRNRFGKGRVRVKGREGRITGRNIKDKDKGKKGEVSSAAEVYIDLFGRRG